MKTKRFVALLLAAIVMLSTVAASANVLVFDHILKKGMRDDTDTYPDSEDDIKYMQQRLAYYEFYTGKYDGIFGPAMYKAVVAFQKKNNLKADGKIGYNTYTALVAPDSLKKSSYKVEDDTVLDSDDQPSSQTVTFNSIRPGDSGETVKAVQRRLRNVFLFLPDTFAISGQYDATTANAVKAFQAAVGLSQDGIVGKKTWAKLNAAADDVFPIGTKVRRTLRHGMRGYDVKVVQKRLVNENYLASLNVVTVGYFDTATVNAVTALQKKNNYKQTGILDASTRSLLWGQKIEEELLDYDASLSTEDDPYVRPTLKYGSTGAYVRSAQKYLRAGGYMTTKADGIYGKATKTAVELFQSKNGLKVDGKIGKQTWAKLMTIDITQDDLVPSTDPEDSSGSTTPTSNILKYGSRGTNVKLLQEKLILLTLLDVGDDDGVFGKKTDAAVRTFQAQVGTKVDGKVGPQTFAAIYHKLGLD
jgi:peptidoglycan hydrolase-like protein with peptidoglycan-binding domain